MTTDPVQISDVGERRYFNNAICHQAVVQGISSELGMHVFNPHVDFPYWLAAEEVN